MGVLHEEHAGERQEEHVEAEQPLPASPNADVLLPGSTNVRELNERFGLDVPEGEFTTVGGYIFGALGRVPVPGDRVTASHAVFTVRSMAGRRIETLAVDLHS